MTAEPDLLRRIERRAFWVFGIMMIVAAASGGIRAILGVVGGALLVAVSYRAIQGGVDALVEGPRAGTSRGGVSSTIWRLVKFITRFAILAAIAYVMMVRLRAQPVWMLVGASSLVAAAALEAVRTPRARPQDRQAPDTRIRPTDNEL
jgi:uncharacterized membrane protein YhaH (DUF805 family)